MADETFQATLARLADETGMSPATVELEAVASLKELAADQHPAAVNSWDRLLSMGSRAYKIDVDDEQIKRLKELNKEKTLVFLPNHRSYLDPAILRAPLKRHGFPPNHTLGGVNLAFWPVGPIGRRNGLIFIRREFKDAPVYKAALGAYLAYLVRHHDNMEWYIEGGRTRTGKLRPPRMGLLSYLVDAFVENAKPNEDIALVPTFVGYDQQYEVADISAEEQGGKKSPESAKWAYNFLRAQSRRRGSAHLRFGEPISMREAVDLSVEIGKDSGLSREQLGRLAVPKLAFEVMHRINLATPIMPTALVAYAVLDNEGRALTVRDGRMILEPLVEYIRARGLDIANNLDLSSEGVMGDAVETLVKEQVLETYNGGSEPVFWIPDNKLHEAAYYRNTLIHFLVTRSIVELAAVKVQEENSDDVTAAVWEESLKIRDLLKYEFFFASKREFSQEIIDECNLALPGWNTPGFSAEDTKIGLKKIKLHVTHRVLESFLSAYSVFADHLASKNVQKYLDKDTFVEECIGVARQAYLQQKLGTPEAISKDFFINAWRLADNRGLLGIGGTELQQAREAFAAELDDYVRRSRVLAKFAQKNRKRNHNV